MEQLLQNKKILFLSPAFFNYEYTIKDKMEQMGASVVFYDERSVKSAFSRALLKISPSIFRKNSYKYFNAIIEENKNMAFDYILIIKCDMLSEKTLEEIRVAFPSAKMCLHVWDSINNISGIKDKIKHFDYATSFDRNDCNAGIGFRFRPLFFSDDFYVRDVVSEDNKYDISFCGTIHSDRYDILKKIEEQCKEDGLRFCSFYYLQSKFIYYYYRLVKKSFRGTIPEMFSFEKKSHREIADIEDSTKIIIDIQHPEQSGLTMRTIEMVGLKKKIVTTNTDIINYDFYDSANICVIDRKNPVLDKKFLMIPYKELPEVIYRKYCLSQWIVDVFGIGDKKI